MSDTAVTFGRSMLHRFDVDWAQQGFDEAALDELAEFCLRVLHSFLADPGRPPRSGADLRRYLARWIGPAIAYPQLARAMDPLPAPSATRPAPLAGGLLIPGKDLRISGNSLLTRGERPWPCSPPRPWLPVWSDPAHTRV